jgi:CO dehydrogenase/acetyl-CoA synthase gamma subunit (corrinoid Fe-S protein)
MHFERASIVGGIAVPSGKQLPAFRRRALFHLRCVAVHNSLWSAKSFSWKQNDSTKCRKLFTDREVVTSQDFNLRYQLQEILKSRKVLLYQATKSNWKKFKEKLLITLKLILNV